MLWAFGPWALLAYASLFKSIRNIVKKEPLKEYATLSGFFIMFLVFSLSKFQLPHYLNIIFPYLAIIVAQYIVSLTKKGEKFFKISQIINIVLFFPLAFFVYFYFQPGRIFIFISLTVFVLGLGSYVLLKEKQGRSKYLYLSVLVSVYVGLFLNLVFYPKLLTYQGEIEAAKYVNEHYPERAKAATFQTDLFEFYVDGQITRLENIEEIKRLNPGTIVFSQDEYLPTLDNEDINYSIVKTFKHYRITRLKPQFLNPETREQTLRSMCLIKVEP